MLLSNLSILVDERVENGFSLETSLGLAAQLTTQDTSLALQLTHHISLLTKIQLRLIVPHGLPVQIYFELLILFLELRYGLCLTLAQIGLCQQLCLHLLQILVHHFVLGLQRPDLLQ